MLLYFVEQRAIDPADISTRSFGSEKARSGSGQAVIEKNRRVDIVLHSVQLSTAIADDSTAKTAAGTGKSSSSKPSEQTEAAASTHG